ncbi:MAG: PilN domain-containing protein [Endomicrobia bacterium]|nr:PilN domain-containing protein [Endomicrobiia bacterium]
MVNINLLPKELIEQQKFKTLITLVITVGCIFGGLLLLVYAARRITLMGMQLELAGIEREIQSLQSVVNEVKQLEEVKQKLEKRKGLVEQLLSSGLIYPKFMVELLRVLPENVWLVNMNTTTLYEPTEGKITGLKVTLTCSSYDKISIADFLSNLENSDKFQTPKLGPINITPQEKYELHNFTVEFNYIPK